MISNDPEIKVSKDENDTILNLDGIINPILYYNNNDIIILDNVLTEEECDKIKGLIEDKEYTKKRSKQCLKFSELSKIIGERCERYIPNNLYIEDELLNHTNTKIWIKESININWRLVKCDLNSCLTQHFDSVLVESVDHKSIYTVMIYLEDSDGDLKFKNYQITPKKGRVVFFNQNLLHEGLPNISKIKYYIRSEILYRRLESIETNDDIKALNIYKQALSINNIDFDEACELEQAAFKLSPILEKMILNL